MIISVVYLLVRCLLGCLMMLTRHRVSKDSELLVLRHENTVLRRQIGRVRYEPGDRLWLAACRDWFAPPVGRGVRGDPGDAARLAPSAGRAEVGLREPTAARAAVHVLQLPFHGECLAAASSVTARSAALGYVE